MIETIWEWSLRIVTGLSMLVGIVGLTAVVLYAGWGLFQLVAKHLKLVGIIWEFVYFKYKRKNEAFLLEELALVRVELEKARKERDALKPKCPRCGKILVDGGPVGVYCANVNCNDRPEL